MGERFRHPSLRASLSLVRQTLCVCIHTRAWMGVQFHTRGEKDFTICLSAVCSAHMRGGHDFEFVFWLMFCIVTERSPCQEGAAPQASYIEPFAAQTCAWSSRNTFAAQNLCRKDQYEDGRSANTRREEQSEDGPSAKVLFEDAEPEPCYATMSVLRIAMQRCHATQCHDVVPRHEFMPCHVMFAPKTSSRRGGCVAYSSRRAFAPPWSKHPPGERSQRSPHGEDVRGASPRRSPGRWVGALADAPSLPWGKRAPGGRSQRSPPPGGRPGQ
jgi:hypothetical protein